MLVRPPHVAGGSGGIRAVSGGEGNASRAFLQNHSSAPPLMSAPSALNQPRLTKLAQAGAGAPKKLRGAGAELTEARRALLQDPRAPVFPVKTHDCGNIPRPQETNRGQIFAVVAGQMRDGRSKTGPEASRPGASRSPM